MKFFGVLLPFWKHERILLVKKTRCLPHWNCFIIMQYGYCLKGAILSERRHGLPGRSLYSYMANVKSVVLIIGRGYTMRTRLRRDKLCTPIWVRIECDTAGPRPDSRPTYCLNNNFKRMSHCISDYSDLSPLNTDKTCLNMLGAVKKRKMFE